MYQETDKHCRECQCTACILRGTLKCIDGENMCNQCKNDDHTNTCFYFEDGSEQW